MTSKQARQVNIKDLNIALVAYNCNMEHRHAMVKMKLLVDPPQVTASLFEEPEFAQTLK